MPPGFSASRRPVAVRHHQDRDPVVVEAGQQLHDLERPRRVEVARRLVRQQHARRGDDRARDRDPLLLPARQFGGRVVPPVGQPDLVQRGHRCLPPGERLFAAIQQGQLDVFQCVGPRQQVEPLKNETEVAATQQRALVARQRLDVEALKQEFAGGRHVEAAEDVHHRRFAGSRRTHHGHEVTRLDVEVDAAQGLETSRAGAKRLGHAPQLDQRCARLIAHRRSPQRAHP